MAAGLVLAVSRDGEHRFSKVTAPEIRILSGLGVEGDAHQGQTVQHRSRVEIDPRQPNLRQVHLIQSELFDELAHKGFALKPGDLGENIATRGIDLLALPRGTRLRIGAEAELEITGLRNPCGQIDSFRPGLLAQLATRTAAGAIIRKAGIMTIARTDGSVRPGDRIVAILPPVPHLPLDRV